MVRIQAALDRAQLVRYVRLNAHSERRRQVRNSLKTGGLLRGYREALRLGHLNGLPGFIVRADDTPELFTVRVIDVAGEF